MGGDIRDIVKYIPRFIEIRSGVSGPPGRGRHLAIPITLAVRFSNGLCYRTSCDCKQCHLCKFVCIHIYTVSQKRIPPNHLR